MRTPLQMKGLLLCRPQAIKPCPHPLWQPSSGSPILGNGGSVLRRSCGIGHSRWRGPLAAASNASVGGFPAETSSSSDADTPEVPALRNTIVSFIKQARRGVLRASALVSVALETPHFRLFIQSAQFLMSILFVALYVLSTYSPPVRGSPRYALELFLCGIFAIEYIHRLFCNHPDWGSKLRTVTSPRNIADLFSFAPSLIEATLQLFVPEFSLGPLDLRWVKLLRSMRVMRIGLLGSELRSLHLSTKRGGWLTAGANFRLLQLATSVFMLLFIATSVIQIVEKLPFHKALYLVGTTLSTVGYGDVVPLTALGRACILGMIAVGIVLIPVQAAAFYSEVNARRVVRGSLPDWRGKPFVLLSTRLTEVRAFSDLFAEFQQALGSSTRFHPNTKLVALCNRPSFEFSAFQELHERAITLVEGSAVSGQDLVTVSAERAQGIMLLADRFTTDPESEDLGILFQVWASKSYTKRVPLFVQTLRQATVRQIAPFLDPEQDVIVSMETTRYRLLALSAVCPGASTLVGNLLRSSAVRPAEAQEPTLAGRRWLREYVNGCGYSFCTAPMQRHLVGKRFLDVVEWLYRTSGHVLIGVIDAEGEVRLNPASKVLFMGMHLLAVGTNKREVRKALAAAFVPGLMTAPSEDLGPPKQETSAVGEGREECCFPVIWGIPESDSVDIQDENVPCIPVNAAEELRSESDVSAFVYRFTNDADAREEQQAHGHLEMRTVERLQKEARQQQLDMRYTSISSFVNHIILCGHGGSVVPFMGYLRVAEPSRAVPLVILAPSPPQDFETAGEKYGPVYYVPGSPADATALRAAGAASAKALVYLARGSRPVKTAQATGAAVEVERSTREAVLADANALLACYGVGEESGAMLTHAVVELLFTTSIEFLQPGLLLKGVSAIYDEDRGSEEGQPRRSWLARAWQQQEAVAEGLAEWQCNPYYAAGRVTVPALMDTFATQAFFNKGLLVDVLAELCGDLDRGTDFNEGTGASEIKGSERMASASAGKGLPPTRTVGWEAGGALLRQVPVPSKYVGSTYGKLFEGLVKEENAVCLGLYRRKAENPATRLSYVVVNPSKDEKLQMTDRLFLLIDRKVL